MTAFRSLHPVWVLISSVQLCTHHLSSPPAACRQPSLDEEMQFPLNSTAQHTHPTAAPVLPVPSNYSADPEEQMKNLNAC